MRKGILIVLCVAIVVAILVTSSNRPSRAPVELKLVSAKSVGSVNGKKFMRVTANISNRSRITLVFNSISDIQAKVRGQWIEVDQGIDVGLGWVYAGKSKQQRFSLPEEAEACRLRFMYYVDIQQPVSPRREALAKLGPWAERLVRKSSKLEKWFADELEPGTKEMTLELGIPPRNADQL